MKKRILAAVLSMSMVMGMTLVVNATEITPDSETGNYSHEFKSESEVNSPVVKVTVPSANVDIVINPYQIEYEDAESNKSSDQIIFPVQKIESSSNVPLSVSVELLAEVDTDSSAVIATAAPTSKVTTKSVFLFMKLGLGDAMPTDAAQIKSINFTTKKVTTATNLDIPKVADTDADKESAVFQIGGSVATAPATPWTDKDTVTCTYKFTFVPKLISTTP